MNPHTCLIRLHPWRGSGILGLMSKPVDSQPRPVRVRFAPSPTGYLHVGGARTALYNFLFARHHKGTFVLRIEDTDQARSTEESLKMVLEDLRWLGIQWDEGPDSQTRQDHGPFGPYRQSQRLEIYKKHAQTLLRTGRAYYCFLTDEELEAQRAKATAENRQPHVVSPYADWTLAQAQEKIDSGGKAVVRFKTKGLEKDYTFRDLIRGEITFPSDMVGDFVLLRSDGMPVYNFCCAVDDAEMRISHVFRAEEHLSNTLRQLMIYEGLGYSPPEFGHLSLVLDEDRQKLSKRKGATSCHEFMREGYHPEALKNFITLLGWSHPEGKEIFTETEAVQCFDGTRLNPAGAVFDGTKLKWMNAQWLRSLSDEDLIRLANKFNPGWFKGVQNPERFAAYLKNYLETLNDIPELLEIFNTEGFSVTPEARTFLDTHPCKPVIAAWISALSDPSVGDFLTVEKFTAIQELIKNQTGVKGKPLFLSLRIAILGKTEGADLKMIIGLFSVQSLLRRAQALGL